MKSGWRQASNMELSKGSVVAPVLLNSFINDLDDGTEQSLMMTQNWEEWLVHQGAMLPFKGT